jgi:hypothetical protein
MMGGYYQGKIKVVGEDLMCFPADPVTLEPLSCGCYDPYAWSCPDHEPVETIGIEEWQDRRNKLRGGACGKGGGDGLSSNDGSALC